MAEVVPASRRPGVPSQTAEHASPIGLVLADAYPVLLEGLEHLFKSEPGFRVLASCTEGGEALRVVRQLRPDVFVLDLDISGTGAWPILRHLAADHVATRIVVTAARINDEEMIEATRLGVKGIILKSMSRQQLVQCVRKVHRGATWLEKVSTGQAVERLVQRDASYREAAGMLTPREFQVFRMALGGRSNKEIADGLAISEGTVKSHLHRIYDKLNVKGRFGLTLYAHDKGLLSTAIGVGERVDRSVK